MINLTPSDTGKLARLSNGLVVGPLKYYYFNDWPQWHLAGSSDFLWNGDGSPVFVRHDSIIEVLDMPTKKLTITKDDVGRWVKLRNGWIVGPIVTVGRLEANIDEIGNFYLNGGRYSDRQCSLDIIAVIDPPDQEDHA